ncbi:MAG: DUF1311 domain-containing protein [Pedobacter sp.]|nr:MAG: DUF1311 domain-containing protein [Pedobacter sp.]
MRILFITLFFIISFSLSICSQSYIKEADIKKLEVKYQACLDNGDYMLGCSNQFYVEMDSCLNVAYKQLRQTSDELVKAALKKEQLEWLKIRDRKFAYIDKTNKDEGQDGEMFRRDEKANFVKERVLVLIRKLN